MLIKVSAELGFDVWFENRDAFICAATTVSSMFISYKGRFNTCAAVYMTNQSAF